MTAGQWQEVKDRFHDAREKPTEARQAYLSESCSDEIVRAEVGRLLLEYGRAGGFLSQPVSASSSAFEGGPFDLGSDFSGTQRFTVQERLGAGTFGVVYRVFDQERNSMLALKKLRQFHPAHLLRFKHEFRSLVDLLHPNLVQLYELFGEDSQWFFTMELVQGLDFLSYVREGNVIVSWERLRDSLSQLATAVQALHSFARLHRDIKPSNVLVTADGRVVLLDFGLVEEFEAHSIEQTFALAGSPAYMAPEQAACGSINEAADWYSVGVMLYRAITGQLPFIGTWSEVLERKQKELAPCSRDLAPDVPEDLNKACRHLLERNPELRSKGIEILLAGKRRNPRGTSRPREEFIGRSIELNLLRERFAALSSGNRQAVMLQGQSGIGKTTLISHFLSGLKRERPDVVILRGRCRESESLPYKALDPIADELVRHLRSLAGTIGIALLPKHPELLRRLFPVFGQIETPSAFPDKSLSTLDEQQIRRLAFEALCELLSRMTAQSPIVISIDDLQWGDLDSIAFIADLVLPANAPPLMLILSFRSEEADSNPQIRAVRGVQRRLTDAGSCLDIEIKGLSEDEGRDLLALLQTKSGPITEKQSHEILQEAGGSPLLLSELLRFASREIDAGETPRPAGAVLIGDMIRHRAGTLSSTARQLLEALAVAGEPVSKALLYHVIDAAGEDPAREIGLLIREHLVRVTGGSQGARLEPFHDQVREASLSWISPAELRNWHAQLARLLQAETGTDPQRLLRHYRGSGNLPAAFETALAAAKTSEAALAFEQAAQFYGAAIETDQADGPTRASLYRKRGDSLSKAGRGYESGQCYLEATRWPAHIDVVEMRRSAAEQLIRSGHLDEGTLLFTELLGSNGIHMPAKRIQILLRMLALRLFIRVRGLRWSERTEAEIPDRTLRKLDLLWSGAMTLVSTDTISGSYLQALHMLTALRAGEPSRLASSLSFAAVYECMGGTREYAHGRKLISLAQQLAERLNDPFLLAVTFGCWAGLDFLSGRVQDGLSHCRTSIGGLQAANRRDRAWELGTFNMLLIWFLGWGGRIRELSETLPILAEEARSRGDVYTEVYVRCCGTSHLVQLAADNPEQAMTEIARSMNQWRKTSYDLPHLYATFSGVECLLYAGRTEEARQLLLSDWQAIRRSLYTRKSQIHRTILGYLRGRTALAGWLRNPNDRELRVEIEQCAGRLIKLRSVWGEAFSILLRAGVMAGLKHRTEAILLLARAEAILREQALLMLAAAVSRRRGELEDETGFERIQAADAFMKSENILRPDRMTAMILPGGWL